MVRDCAEFIGIIGRGYKDKWGNDTAEYFDFGIIQINVTDEERKALFACLNDFFVERKSDSEHSTFRVYEYDGGFVSIQRIGRDNKKILITTYWTIHVSRSSALKMWDDLKNLIKPKCERDKS